MGKAEVLQAAVSIERNGAAFYREAADYMMEEPARQMMLRLAAMEDSHAKIFSCMQAPSGADQKADERAVALLHYLADEGVFGAAEVSPMRLAQEGNVQEILRKALGMEKDSVVFYAALKDMLPDPASQEAVDSIIREELGHITLLAGELEARNRKK